MNMPLVITDNITEVLVKIIEFTQIRQRIVINNIHNMHSLGFVPQDVAVDEFSALLDSAITEHVTNGRLVLYDTDSIKFGEEGSFEIKSIVDHYGKKLLDENRDKYLELQINKLLENSLNLKVAMELLKQKQGMVSIFG